MALILYLERAPRYENIITKEYETIPRDDIALIESYFNWQKERADGGKYSCDTLEEWCGVPASKLPHKYIISHYSDFFIKRVVYSEIAGEVERYCIFEQLARIPKANQIFNWFIQNVMNGEPSKKHYNVTKDQLSMLLDALNKVKNSISEVGIVNEKVAKCVMPVLTNGGYFFGTTEYDAIYTAQIIDAIDIINNILSTTDFNEQAIYFNATW